MSQHVVNLVRLRSTYSNELAPVLWLIPPRDFSRAQQKQLSLNLFVAVLRSAVIT